MSVAKQLMCDLPSCLPGTPLIAFDSAVKRGAILNYNLPAFTTFTVRLFIPVQVPDEFWNEEARSLPDGDSAYVEAPKQEKPTVPSVVAPHLSSSRDTLKSAFQDIPLTTKPWDTKDLSTPPRWWEAVGKMDNAVREMGAANPSLKALRDLSISKDFTKELFGPLTPVSSVLTQSEVIDDARRSEYSPTMLLMGLADGKVPIWSTSFYGRKRLLKMNNPVTKSRPQFYVIEELEVASFLGDYGAGRTIKTFSLLPGEKTTISIKTWRTETTEKNIKQNILDSYTEESANEFERQVNDEASTSMQTSAAEASAFSTNHSSASQESANGSVGGGFNIVVAHADGGYDWASASQASDTNSSQSSASTSRSAAADAVQKALDRHVNQSSLARKTEVNVETQEKTSVETGMEQTITRELQNINHSRALNFVFRTLDQEFLTVVYLKNISFGFTKGVPGDGISFRLDNLDRSLARWLVSASAVKQIRNKILENLLAVIDFDGMAHPFIKQEQIQIPSLEDDASPNKTQPFRYWRKNPDLGQPGLDRSNTYEGKAVNGIILSAAKRILPTDAIIVEALLGQGEALDCYNMRLQNAAAEKADLENQRTRLGLKILEASKPDMPAAAEAYAEMFNHSHGREKHDGNTRP